MGKLLPLLPLLFLLCSKNPNIDMLLANEWVYVGIIENNGNSIDFKDYFNCSDNEMSTFSIRNNNDKYTLLGENTWDISGEIEFNGDTLIYKEKYWESGVFSPPNCPFPRDNYLEMLVEVIKKGVCFTITGDTLMLSNSGGNKFVCEKMRKEM